MIRHPLLLALVLGGSVFFLQWVRTRPVAGRFFRPMPLPFWCYFLPMLASSAGLIPSQSPVYGFLSKYALPFCLSLLLVAVDLKALASLGRAALLVMAMAVAGIVAGAAASFAVFHPFLPPDSWKAVGALSGSWLGGSANMLAIKEALTVPDAVFAPAVVVDTFIAYGWMALLIFLAGFQKRFDRWIGAEDAGSWAVPDLPGGEKTIPLAGALTACLVISALSFAAGSALPPVGTLISGMTWTILTVTTVSLLVSLTGRFRSQGARLEKIGTTILYILLASVGARAPLSSILTAPVFLAVGLMWVLIHGAFLLGASRIFRAPLFLLATASQACLGGPVSAPIVAAVYRPPLAAVGLLLAIVGNIIGTYLGLLVAVICRWIETI